MPNTIVRVRRDRTVDVKLGVDAHDVAADMIFAANNRQLVLTATINGKPMVAHPGDDIVAVYVAWRDSESSWDQPHDPDVVVVDGVKVPWPRAHQTQLTAVGVRAEIESILRTLTLLAANPQVVALTSQWAYPDSPGGEMRRVKDALGRAIASAQMSDPSAPTGSGL